MTGPEIAKAIRDLEYARSDERAKRMRQYDDEIHSPAIRSLIEQCAHEPMSYWRRNGIGWSWLECKFCGHELDKGPTDEHGGVLFQNGNSSKLPRDVCRCVATTCGKRDTCARFMDCEADDGRGLGPLSFADLSPTAPPFYCPFYIEFKPKP